MVRACFAFALIAAVGCGPQRSYYEAAHLVDIETERRDEIARWLKTATDAERPTFEASYDRQCQRIERALDLRDAAEVREFGPTPTAARLPSP